MAKRGERLSTSWITSASEVNAKAILFFNSMISKHNTSPVIVVCATETIVANFAALLFPAPNSLDTLTLQN